MRSSQAAEAAVDAALQWLATHQEPDGHWDTTKYASDQKTDTACTGLALLAFLGAGHTEKVGEYRDNVRRAVTWLKSRQNASGLIFDQTDAGGHRGVGYPHAIAGMAMAESAGMGNVAETITATQKALDYTTKVHQSSDGGFRYRAGSAGDLSVTGWFVMQLNSAKLAGLNVEHASFGRVTRFLDGCELKAGRSASTYKYAPKDLPDEYLPFSLGGSVLMKTSHTNHRLTAIGVLCRQLLGSRKEDLQASVAWFMGKGGVPDGWGEGKTDLYYWYYGTLCSFNQGGDIWMKWNEAMQKTMCESQRRGGDEDGSWDPVGLYSKEWGRVGQTALAVLCLEAYYRFPYSLRAERLKAVRARCTPWTRQTPHQNGPFVRDAPVQGTGLTPDPKRDDERRPDAPAAPRMPPPAPRIPPSAVAFNGHRYFVFQDSVSWQEAKKRCGAQGGYLACVGGRDENEFLVRLTAGKRCWLGGYSNRDRAWSWVNGSPFAYSRWADGEPNGVGTFLVLNWYGSDGRWNDHPDHTSYGGVKGFVCEWDTQR